MKLVLLTIMVACILFVVGITICIIIMHDVAVEVRAQNIKMKNQVEEIQKSVSYISASNAEKFSKN